MSKLDNLTHWDGLLPNALETFPDVERLVLSQTSGMKNLINALKSNKGLFKLEESVKIFNPEFIKVRVVLSKDRPIAWAWVSPYRQLFNGKFYRRRLSFMVFVDPKFRRNEIGLTLYQWAQQVALQSKRPLIVFPWEHISGHFYSDKCKVPLKYQADWF